MKNIEEEEGEHHEDEDHDDEHPEDEILEAALQLKLNTYSYDVKWHLPKMKNIETVIGVQGMHQKNKNFGEEILIPDATINDVGFFVTGMYQFDNNSLQAGIRFDTRNISTELSRSIRTKMKFIFLMQLINLLTIFQLH